MIYIFLDVANQSNSSIHAPIPIISPTIHHYPSASSTLANVAARRIVQQTGNPAQPAQQPGMSLW